MNACLDAIAVAATYSLVAFLCLVLTADVIVRTEIEAVAIMFPILTLFELARARAARR